ncbi:hypothetical protein [Comamonas aquatica]|uniref:Uncharacterized protein n=1 Tax=Comamonas aquatica TaxID=225991 RepID=A0AA42HUR9_9BURK|nr:hypothetical protein [Comamonas aquatica]MDH0364661.1 hypothetical protein [Comamonas aquatica]
MKRYGGMHVMIQARYRLAIILLHALLSRTVTAMSRVTVAWLTLFMLLQQIGLGLSGLPTTPDFTGFAHWWFY